MTLNSPFCTGMTSSGPLRAPLYLSIPYPLIAAVSFLFPSTLGFTHCHSFGVKVWQGLRGEPDKWVNWVNYEMSHPPIFVLISLLDDILLQSRLNTLC
ncbi:hypothetical protein VNO77_17838 [Canavalia gladiata]|uniref:Uncharacterized protein n=1 Tax=Canavalia gladiata TaxID=3824 RepID=A0AAN9LNB4_CANGL